MKTLAQKLFPGLVLLFASFAPAMVNGVTFTVTPSAISNTYSGALTLQAGGLTSGDTVIVQKFLDTNTNGVVDASDLLMQQFQLTDGRASVFTNGTTSVTNFNVPGDTDGAVNGQITAQLYPGLDFAQEVVGKYLFVFSSPAGHFPPQTNSFSVTNFPYAQSFAGNVVNNGANVPNAVVILFQPQGNNSQHPVASTVANSSGAYTIKAPPGTFLLGAIKSNLVANLAASPYVTLGAGATITTNVPLTNATQTISGNMIDVNNSSLGLAGCLVPVQTVSNLLAVTFTDTNGNYAADVTPDFWKVQGSSQSLAFHGYLKSQNSVKVNTTSGSVAGVTLALPKGTAIFYGTVRDNSGNPLSGIDIYSSDNNGNYEADGYSYTNGNYVALAIGGLNNEQWQVQVSSDSNPANYIFSQGVNNITLGPGQAYHYNFTALPATNHITGYVQGGINNPLSGIGVNADNGAGYSAHAHTDANGNYDLTVANGYTWNVSLNCCNNCSDGVPATYQCPNPQPVSINNNNGVANFTVLPPNSGQIFGYVTDAYGNGLVGVSVYATDGVGDNYSTTTDGSGYYSVTVVNGSYDVSVDCGQLNARNFNCVSDDSPSITDNSTEADFMVTFISAPNYPFAVLHGFSATGINPNGSGTNSDGASPFGGLLLSGGTLFGTAAYGGTNGTGAVFAGNTNLSNFSVVHAFSTDATNRLGIFTNSDGTSPAGLMLAGNILYGATVYEGANGNGTVFALSTNGTGFRVLHTFTPLDAATLTTNSDGANPFAAPVLFGALLYGTAAAGGTNGNGTVFAVNTNGSLTVLHSFTAIDMSAFPFTNSDGANPHAGLILSGTTLYGTASSGGGGGFGTVFAVNANGTGFTNLYSFAGGDDGANPAAGLLLSGATLYGTAADGGHWGAGTVFAVSTNGTGFTVLHGFTGGADGRTPQAGLILSNNTLYGTAINDGGSNSGTVFAVNVNGTNFNVLHAFTGGDDGANPSGSLVLAGNTLYGTTSAGGSAGNGTVFAVSITQSVAPAISLPAGSPSGQFQMLVTAPAGQNYTVQMSTNLASTNWTSLLVTNPSSSVFLFSDPNATNKQRYYRVRVGP